MKCLTIKISNKYLNESEYYNDSETNIWMQIEHFPLVAEKLSTPIDHSWSPPTEKLSEIFLAIFTWFFSRGYVYLEARQCQMYMLITTCPLSQQ